jgi:hypothetical protein
MENCPISPVTQNLFRWFPLFDTYFIWNYRSRGFHKCKSLMPSSSALIPMSICTLQCLFSHSFTTYEWLNRHCDAQIYIGITSRWTGYKLCGTVTRFCVNAEKRPKQYIKREKSTFDEKILKLLHGPIFPILLEKNNNFLKNVIK